MSNLLDVNVLVALTWPNHVHHSAAIEWFSTHHQHGWATCPMTQSGFLRVSTNRGVIPDARPMPEAADVLGALTSLDGHAFWVDDVSLVDCREIDVSTLSGYRQLTDAHLVALAMRRGGALVTFDQRIRALAPRPSAVVTLSL